MSSSHENNGKSDCVKYKDVSVTGTLQVHKIKGFSPIQFTDPVIMDETLEVSKRANVAKLGLTDVITESSATAGAATALPSTPEGYFPVEVMGNTYYVPYFNAPEQQ